MNIKTWSIRQFLPMTLVATAFLASCSTPVPVQDLSEARAEIARAESEKAASFASKDFNAARESLLASHEDLKKEKYKEAKVNAKASYTNAVAARMVSAPQYASEQKAESSTAIAAADEAYAEKLASSDFEVAKQLNDEGTQSLSLANEKKASLVNAAPADLPIKQKETLAQYTNAINKFEASRQASEKARSQSLAQKDDMLQMVDSARTSLGKAESYNAKKYAAEAYANGVSEVNLAETDIKADKLKSGDSHLQKAQEYSATALAASSEKYSGVRLDEAKSSVAKASNLYDQVKAKNPKNPELAKNGEYLTAAKEAVSSSESSIKNRQYEDAIKEADQAMNLSGIVNEQLTAIAARNAPAGVKKEQTPAKVTTPATEATTGEGWTTYTVEKKHPADCLWYIAGYKKNYGDPRMWKRIYEANRDIIHDPNVIYPGQVLQIPPPDGPVTKPASKDEKKEDVVEPTSEGDDQPRENIENPGEVDEPVEE